MNKENKTMKVKNISTDTRKMHYPIPYVFPPGETVTVTYSIGEGLIKQQEFVEVKKKERTGDRKAADKKKGKVS